MNYFVDWQLFGIAQISEIRQQKMMLEPVEQQQCVAALISCVDQSGCDRRVRHDVIVRMNTCIVTNSNCRFVDDQTAVLTALITALADHAEIVRSASIQCIHVYVHHTDMSAAAITALIAALTHRLSRETAESVRRGIMQIGIAVADAADDDAVTALCIIGLRDALAAVVIDSAIALEKLANARTTTSTAPVQPLTMALRHHHADVRRHAVNALAAMALRTTSIDFASVADAHVANEKSAKVLTAIATAVCAIVCAHRSDDADEARLLSVLLVLDCRLLWPFNSLREHIASIVTACSASYDIRERVAVNVADIIRSADAMTKDWTNTRRRRGIAILNSLADFAPQTLTHNTEALIPLLRRVIRDEQQDERALVAETTNKLVAAMDVALIVSAVQTSSLDAVNLRIVNLMIRARAVSADVMTPLLEALRHAINDDVDSAVRAELRSLFAAVIVVGGGDARVVVACLVALDAVSVDGDVDELYTAAQSAYNVEVAHLAAAEFMQIRIDETPFAVRRCVRLLRRCAPVLARYQSRVIPLLVSLSADTRDTITRSRAVDVIGALTTDAALLNADAIALMTAALIRNCTWRVGKAASALRMQSITTLSRLLDVAADDVFADAQYRDDVLSVALAAIDDDELPIRRAALALTHRLLAFHVRDVARVVSLLLGRLDDCDDELRIGACELIRIALRDHADELAIQSAIIERSVRTHCHDTNAQVAAAATAVVAAMIK